MNANPKTENRSSNSDGAEVVEMSRGPGLRFLTREELAEVLRVSIRTVDAMVAAGEIPTVRLRGAIVRFYLPDVVRHLTATALTRKRGRGALGTQLRVESGEPASNCISDFRSQISKSQK